MNKRSNLLWIGISLVTLAAYALLIDKSFSSWQMNNDKSYNYSLWVPITLAIPLLFRKYNYYKLAFVIFLFETITVILSPTCYIEMTTIFTLEVLWIPAVGIGLLMKRKIPFRNKWMVALASFVFTYTLFPATQVLGEAFIAYYYHLIPICPS